MPRERAPLPASAAAQEAELALRDALDPVEASAPYSPAGTSPVPKADSCPHEALELQTDPKCATAPVARERLLGLLRERFSAPTWLDAEAKRCPSEYSAELAGVRFRRESYRRQLAARRELDSALRQLEGCAGFEPGMIRLLRVHYLPECAEALSQPTLLDGTVSAPLRWALRGMATKTRVAGLRSAIEKGEPRISEKDDSRRIEAKLTPWFAQQRALLRAASLLTAELPAGSYGRALAELELSALAKSIWEARSRVSVHVSAAPRQVTESLGALLNADGPQLLAVAGGAANVVSLVGDWQQIESWWPPPRVRSWDVPQQLLLPPSPGEPDLGGDDRALALLPSYVAARILPLPELGLEQLRALAVAGWDPRVRRSLTRRLDDPQIAALFARERVKMMLRSFEPMQARSAARLEHVAHPGGGAFAALCETLARTPAGPDAWLEAEVLPGAAGLLQQAAAVETNALDRAWLVHDAVLLAGSNATEVLKEFPGYTITTGDRAFPWCWAGAIREHPCSCPSLRNL